MEAINWKLFSTGNWKLCHWKLSLWKLFYDVGFSGGGITAVKSL